MNPFDGLSDDPKIAFSQAISDMCDLFAFFVENEKPVKVERQSVSDDFSILGLCLVDPVSDQSMGIYENTYDSPSEMEDAAFLVKDFMSANGFNVVEGESDRYACELSSEDKIILQEISNSDNVTIHIYNKGDGEVGKNNYTYAISIQTKDSKPLMINKDYTIFDIMSVSMLANFFAMMYSYLGKNVQMTSEFTDQVLVVNKYGVADNAYPG